MRRLPFLVSGREVPSPATDSRRIIINNQIPGRMFAYDPKEINNNWVVWRSRFPPQSMRARHLRLEMDLAWGRWML